MCKTIYRQGRRWPYGAFLFSLLPLIMLFTSATVLSQTVVINMPLSGLRDTVMAQGTYYTLYDDGGDTGNYSNNVNAYYQFIAPAGTQIRATGSYNTESCCDYICIYNGTASNNNNYTRYNGEGNVNFESTGNVVTVYFHSDGSIIREGFAITFHYVRYCDGITQITDSATTHSVHLSWVDTTSASNWWVLYGTNRAALTDTVTTQQTQVVLTDLTPATTYYYCIYNHPLSDSSCVRPIDTVKTHCNEDNACDLFSNLNTCLVTGYYGIYSDPMMHEGIVEGRHTLMTTPGYDPYTHDLLSVIPPGETYAIRLGNNSVGYQAECLVYEYTVDTALHNLLIMKYAAVMQNPHHVNSRQPRFKFDVLDDQMQPLDTACYSADFVSNDSLGWNIGTSNALWKDWTTVGVDLDNLHGQTIYIKLTTYDCNEGGHFGYAYFYLKCDNKTIQATACGDTVANTFTAPSGFTYRWYLATAPDSTLSTAQSLSVDNAGTYCCAMSMVGATGTDCSFVMQATAGHRYPYALLSATLTDTSTCYRGYQFRDNSVITTDPDHNSLTTERCETSLWDFGDGETSTERNPLHYYTPGVYRVTLTSTIGERHCVDTARQTLIVTSPCTIYDTVDVTICEGESYPLFDTIVQDTGTYERDSLFLHRVLYLHHSYQANNDTMVISICNGESFEIGGQYYDTTGYYVNILTNRYGCDSVIRLMLTVHSKYDTSITIHLCEGEYYQVGNRQYGLTGNYTDTLTSIYGCDSIVRMNLTIYPVYEQLVEQNICAGDVFDYAGGEYTETGVYVITNQSQYACDSNTILHIEVTNLPLMEFQMEPGKASLDHPIVRLSDHSRHVSSREWMINGTTLSDEAVVYYHYPIDQDSVLVTLVACSQQNCCDSLTKVLYFDNPQLWAANVFTPDENTNNMFCTKEDGLCSQWVDIYTRGGALVAHFDGLTTCWDGRYEGKLCSQDTYVYIIRYTTTAEPRNERVKKGTVTLLR